MENLDLLAPSQNLSGLDQVIVYKCNLIIIFFQNLKAERQKKKSFPKFKACVKNISFD